MKHLPQSRTPAAPVLPTPVCRVSLQRNCAHGGIHREESAGEDGKRQRPLIQRRAANSAAPVAAPDSVHRTLSSPGRSLDPATRAFMESHFDHDFSRVRVHTDSTAAESAKNVGALAYTVGQNIVFGTGNYDPGHSAGMKLLAHELVHTVQQGSAANFSRSEPIAMGAIDSIHERAAESASATLNFTPHAVTSVAPCLQRKTWQDLPIYEERPDILSDKATKSPAPAKGAAAAPKPGKCEEFPGGSTTCEVNEETGTPTGKVTSLVDEKNPCTRPCVERHEAVHVKQLTKLCPELRDCYLAADKGKRPALDCAKMAIFGSKQRECEAYNVSTPCVEESLRQAGQCQSAENKAYGTRKLASEKCFRDKNCGN